MSYANQIISADRTSVDASMARCSTGDALETNPLRQAHKFNFADDIRFLYRDARGSFGASNTST